MKLTYLMAEQDEEPSDEMKARFEGEPAIVNLGDIENKDLLGMVNEVQDKMTEAGGNARGLQGNYNEMFLWTPQLNSLGEIIARHRLNVGVARPDEFGEVRIGDNNQEPGVYIGRDIWKDEVGLECAVQIPHSKEQQRVLLVNAHVVDETGAFLASLHKKQGDRVHVMDVTTPNRPGWREAAEDAYQALGLSKNEYSFVEGIPDTEVHKHEERFKAELEEKVDEFKPSVIITAPHSGNGDKQTVLKYIWDDVVDPRSDVDLLLGENVQGNRLKPKLYSVVDQDALEKFLEVYKIPGFENPDLGRMVGNMFRSVGRHEALGRATAGRDNVKLFGMQPVWLANKCGYRVPHDTKLFED